MNKRIPTLIFVIGLASACALQADSRNSGKSPARAPGGDPNVCVDTKSHVYYMQGSKCCGQIKKPKYMTKAKAIKEGNKPSSCSKDPIAGPPHDNPSPTPPPSGSHPQ